MHEVFGRAVLIGSGLFSLFTTWSSAAAPQTFAESLGLSIANAGGTNEIRAQYAGFFLAVALACGASAFGAMPRYAGYVVLAVVFGGLILGRVTSLIVDRSLSGYGPTIRALYAIDSLGFVLSLVALTVDGRS